MALLQFGPCHRWRDAVTRSSISLINLAGAESLRSDVDDRS